MSLSTPSLGITSGTSLRPGSMPRRPSTPSLGITRILAGYAISCEKYLAFNSLSRDHIVDPRLPDHIISFQLPLSGSHSQHLRYGPLRLIIVLLSTPSLGITRRRIGCRFHGRSRNTFSTPSLGITWRLDGIIVAVIEELVFNSLSRDHLPSTDRGEV